MKARPNDIKVVSQVGSAVPPRLRAQGHLASWVLMLDGEPHSVSFSSREAAFENRNAWEFAVALRRNAPAFGTSI